MSVDLRNELPCAMCKRRPWVDLLADPEDGTSAILCGRCLGCVERRGFDPYVRWAIAHMAAEDLFNARFEDLEEYCRRRGMAPPETPAPPPEEPAPASGPWKPGPHYEECKVQ